MDHLTRTNTAPSASPAPAAAPAPPPPTQNRLADRASFGNVVRQGFGDWDADSNGHLTQVELRSRMERGGLGPDQAAALEALNGRVDSVQGLSNDEFGRENDGVTVKDAARVKTGSALDKRFRELQADPSQALAAVRKAQERKRGQDLVAGRTGWGGLDEAALGADLLKEKPGVVNAALDGLGDGNKDDVSKEFVKAASDEQLKKLGSRPEGRALLQRMGRHLNEGFVSEEDGRQLNRLGPHAYAKHGRLMGDWMPEGVAASMQNAGAEVQKVADGAGAIKFDEYAITVDRMPPGVTPEKFFGEFARDPNKTVDNGWFDAMNRFDRRREGGEPAPGDLYDIDIGGPDNGDVVMRDASDRHFTFATVTTDRHGEHPEYGVREFGFEKNEDGSTTFYTRGVSRPAPRFDHGLGVRLGGAYPQDWSWTSLVQGLGDTIERRGGAVRKDSLRKTFGPQ